MSVITSIKRQKRKGRYNIYLDGRYAFALDEITLAREKLKVGISLPQSELLRLVGENELNKLFDKVLRFLSYRPRSEKEIRKYLLAKTKAVEMVEKLITRLRNLNYIDDKAFAFWWVEQRTGQQKGKYLIKWELFQKGVAEEIINEVLKSAGDNDLNLAFKAAQKKLKIYKGIKVKKAKQRLSSFLARRGFDWEVIREVIQDTF